MQETLGKLAIKLCEKLPFNLTFYEKDGFCRKPNEDCNYCRKNGEDIHFCNKKTYTPDQELRFT